MRKGTRTVFRLCKCGCGESVPPYISPTSKRVEKYPIYIVGHGRKLRGEQLRAKWRADPFSHPASVPAGTRTIHRSRDGCFYWTVKTDDGKWEYEHRVVLGNTLGRPLTSDEDVHHKDDDTLNNIPDNLEILSHSSHRRMHALRQKTGWSVKYVACVDCGGTERAYASKGRCTLCNQRRRAKERGLGFGRWPKKPNVP